MLRTCISLLALWVLADFATPFIPGAFSFEESKTVHVTTKRAEAPESNVEVLPPSRAVAAVSPDTVVEHHAPRQHLLGEWLPEVRISLLPFRTAAPSDTDPSS
jgi:hypothetical protein